MQETLISQEFQSNYGELLQFQHSSKPTNEETTAGSKKLFAHWGITNNSLPSHMA